MSNIETLKNVFKEALELKPNVDINSLKYQSIPEWDSIGHMRLVAAIDEKFDTMLDTEDVLDMSSFNKAVEILNKYGVNFGQPT